MKKRILCGLLALTLTVSMIGCTKKEDIQVDTPTAPIETPEVEEPEVIPPVEEIPETAPEIKPDTPIKKPESKPDSKPKPTPPVTKPNPKPVAPAKTGDDLAKIILASSSLAQYNTPITKISGDTDQMILDMFQLKPADMDTFAMSASMMNVKAYGIAIIKPAKGKEDTVKKGLESFVAMQCKNFESYLQDQYEIAKAAKVIEVNGYYVMVMCGSENEDMENPPAASDAIDAAIKIIKDSLK